MWKLNLFAAAFCGIATVYAAFMGNVTALIVNAFLCGLNLYFAYIGSQK